MTASEPLVIVSKDAHIGPRLVEGLRPYCPQSSLEESEEASVTVFRSGVGGWS
jgi:hypothetical protein